MKTIIYGLGKRFYNEFFQKYLLPEIIKRYEICGVCDKKSPVNINELDYLFFEPSTKLSEYEVIIITSDLYFSEIKNELISDWEIKENNIVPLDEVEERIIDEVLDGKLFDGLTGVEVGGPSSIFKSIYKNVKKCDGINYSANTVWWKFKGEKYSYNDILLGNMIIADAVDLDVIPSNSYEFCLSSNNLEHIANPIKAILEMKRVLKEDGKLLIVVPRKETCFDHNRNVTLLSHLIDDYNKGILEDDLSHLEEIVLLHDYDMDAGIDSKEQFILRSQDNYINRCLHQHVFDETLLISIFDYLKIKMIKSGIVFYNYFIIGRI